MQQIRKLAPTLFHAVKAVEQGCRKIQVDPHFNLRMGSWMTISDNNCFGCLTTCTLMYLSKKSAKDLIGKFTPKAITPHKSITERAYAYQIAKDADLCFFEFAIDNLRFNDLYRLLDFYGFAGHPHIYEAVDWLYANRSDNLHEESTKADLLSYADFLRDTLIPKLKNWFPLKS